LLLGKITIAGRSRLDNSKNDFARREKMIATPKKPNPYERNMEIFYVQFEEPADQICAAVRKNSAAETPTIALLKELIASNHGTVAPQRIQPNDYVQAHTVVITTDQPARVWQSLNSVPFVRVSRTAAGLRTPEV
jgi:hypothetical protein